MHVHVHASRICVCKSDVMRRDGEGVGMGCSSINRNYASEGLGGGFGWNSDRWRLFLGSADSMESIYICRPPEADVLKKERNNHSSLTPRTILKT
jgi:hypothetical protein